MSDYMRSAGVLSSNKGSTNNQLEDLLKCIICFSKLIDSKMCPFCSKLFCKMCIHRWLIENRSQCPHCRSGLRLEQLVNCRFLNDITQVLENLSVAKKEVLEKCINHGCPLNYYCISCTCAVCSDCAMFSLEHKGHEFQHIADIYNLHVDQINSESKILNKRLNDLELLDADEKIQKFKNAKEEKNRELLNCMEQMQARLDAQLKEKIQVISHNRDEIYAEICKVKDLQNELEIELNQVTKSKLINKSAELVKKLKNIQTLPISKFEHSVVDWEFYSEIVPKYDSGIFILKNFSKIKPTKEVVYSDILNANGITWRLKVYPNGNGIAKSNYLSVFLELLKGYGESAKYDYRVEMVNHLDPSLYVAREFASEFETGECWGYNRFYRIDLLKDEGFLGNNDSLVMKFYVRAATYYQLHKDQKNYIKVLLEKEAIAKEQVQELITKLGKYGENIIKDSVNYTQNEKNMENSFKEEEKRIEDDIFNEMAANSPNELNTMMQKYNISLEEVSLEEEIVPKQLEWNEIKDIPDFHSYSELMSENFFESPDEDEKEFSPLEYFLYREHSL